MGLKLKIISPERIIFDGEVSLVSVPGMQGRFEVMSNHAPIISSLKSGEVVYKTGAEEQKLTIADGFIEVIDNEVSLCVEI
jgi:F-type H+-transporting ATPase subunit epsilon